MRFRASSTISTLVALALLACGPMALAAKEGESPDFQELPEPHPTPTAEQAVLQKTLDISPAPPPAPIQRSSADQFYYRFRHSLGFRAGDIIATGGGGSISLIGTDYSFTDERLRSYAFGADLLSDTTGSIHAWRRFNYGQGRFRPYWKLGVGIRIIPSDELVTFAKYQNWQARAAFGFEHLLWLPSSLRAEIEGFVGQSESALGLSIGYVWAW